MRRLTILAGSTLGLWLYPCRLLSLPDTASLQTFFDLAALQPEMFCDFSVRFSCLLHCHNFRLQYLYLCVFSFLHNTTPCVVYFPTQGAFCLLSVFTGAVHYASVPCYKNTKTLFPKTVSLSVSSTIKDSINWVAFGYPITSSVVSPETTRGAKRTKACTPHSVFLILHMAPWRSNIIFTR